MLTFEVKHIDHATQRKIIHVYKPGRETQLAVIRYRARYRKYTVSFVPGYCPTAAECDEINEYVVAEQAAYKAEVGNSKITLAKRVQVLELLVAELKQRIERLEANARL